jgi:Kef-type K+ transport system membrane component KefB
MSISYKLYTDTFFYFGCITFLCLIIGELVVRIKLLPRISGYMLVGFLCGPNVLKLVNSSMLPDLMILADISLGLILFDIGRHLDFSWLNNDRGLLYSALVEFALTVITISILVMLLGWNLLPSLFAGIIAATTSSMVLLIISRDLSAEGPVTRRSIILTSINNFLAISMLVILLPFAKHKGFMFWHSFLHSSYKLFGSLAFGFVYFKITEKIIIKIIEKQKELQFILLISVLVLSISICKMFDLSKMLVLIFIGISVRNFDKRHVFIDIDFGWTAHLFFIPLFFITGCYLNFAGFMKAPFIIIMFILIRSLCKTIGVTLFTKKSQLTYKQSLSIAAALTPMTGTAIGITSRVLEYNPDIGHKLLTIISGSVAILGIFGPIITQIAFRLAEETLENKEKT